MWIAQGLQDRDAQADTQTSLCQGDLIHVVDGGHGVSIFSAAIPSEGLVSVCSGHLAGSCLLGMRRAERKVRGDMGGGFLC